MCVEKESVLQLPSNPLFTPVPVMDGRFPLKNCVLSVSQFTGAERESLVELAKYLGAEYVYLHVLCLSYTPSSSALSSYAFFVICSALCLPLYHRVQDYFVRLANHKKGMLASTHLVLQSPEGTKYQAAKKWGLPAVTMRWILESARTGQRATEERFLIDLPPPPGYSSLESVISCTF